MSAAHERIAKALAWARHRNITQMEHAYYLGVLWLHWSVCEPPHRVINEQHRDDLVEALRSGWNGPALVGYEQQDKAMLLSGSHRWDATRILNRLVPVRVFTRHEVNEAYGDLDKWRAIMFSAPDARLSWEPPDDWHPK